ncbi:prolyl-tRNA synthetase associated domain-containing protein [Alphaproteobacteria bacterium HT1-32]|nr:prolyl-tRNA synthetase associated domain-containing protein [Alphaproteobacteria bacterium HT1-32]
MSEIPWTPPGPAPTTPEALLARLTALGIETENHTHPPLFTVEDSKALRGDLPGGHCKNLFLKDKKQQLWLVVTLEDRPIRMKALEGVIGAARLSFGKPDLLWDVLGVIPGSVTPFALINDTDLRVRPVIDAGMLEYSPLNYHPLTNEMTSAIRPDDLMTFIRACGHVPIIEDLSGCGG